jgi:hypothetical protein
MDVLSRMTPEEALLCRTARLEIPAADGLETPAADGLEPGLSQLLEKGLDWRTFWNLAHRHEVQPMVWAFLRSRPGCRSAVPADLQQVAERRYFATAVRNRNRSIELGKVLTILERAEVDVLPVKGVALDELVYGSAAPRTFDDLDVLVRRADLERARAALAELGYRGRPVPRFEEVDHRFHDVQLFRAIGGSQQCLEVHWDLWPSSRFDSIVDDLWQRARRERVAGVETRVLSDEDTLLHLAVHRTSSALRLRFVCDVAELVRRRQGTIDWDALEQRATSIQARVALHMVLSLARELLGAPVPAEILAGTRPGPWRRRILDRTCGTRALFRTVARDDHTQQPRLAYRILEQDRPIRVARSLVAGVVRKRAKYVYNRRTRPA